MPYLHKEKRPHQCNKPYVWYYTILGKKFAQRPRARALVPGTIWQCRQCKTKYVLKLHKKYAWVEIEEESDA